MLKTASANSVFKYSRKLVGLLTFRELKSSNYTQKSLVLQVNQALVESMVSECINHTVFAMMFMHRLTRFAFTFATSSSKSRTCSIERRGNYACRNFIKPTRNTWDQLSWRRPHYGDFTDTLWYWKLFGTWQGMVTAICMYGLHTGVDIHVVVDEYVMSTL